MDALGSIFGQRDGATQEQDEVRYHIYGTLPGVETPAGRDSDAAGMAEALEACKAAVLAHLEPHTRGYIWQRDPFQLEVALDFSSDVAAVGRYKLTLA